MAHLRDFFLVAVTVLVSSSLSEAATLTVALDDTDQYTANQLAFGAAADGDTVLVKPGEYVITEPITFQGKAITVRSDGGAEVTCQSFVRCQELGKPSQRRTSEIWSVYGCGQTTTIDVSSSRVWRRSSDSTSGTGANAM
jgi:hypothetical protein